MTIIFKISFFLFQLWNVQTFFILNIPKTILDIGCRNGESTIQLSRQNPDTKIIGIDIDIDENIIQKAKENYPHISFMNIDEYENICQYMNTTNEFDLIHIREDIYIKLLKKFKHKKVAYYFDKILNANGKLQIYSETMTF
jgi:SAM-dependent methyltransferase